MLTVYRVGLARIVAGNRIAHTPDRILVVADDGMQAIQRARDILGAAAIMKECEGVAPEVYDPRDEEGKRLADAPPVYFHPDWPEYVTGRKRLGMAPPSTAEVDLIGADKAAATGRPPDEDEKPEDVEQAQGNELAAQEGSDASADAPIDEFARALAGGSDQAGADRAALSDNAGVKTPEERAARRAAAKAKSGK